MITYLVGHFDSRQDRGAQKQIKACSDQTQWTDEVCEFRVLQFFLSLRQHNCPLPAASENAENCV